MALNQFPYTNFHELNGDYVLQTVQQASADAQAAAQSAQAAAAGVAAADAKATEALARSMEAQAAAAGVAAADAKATEALARSMEAGTAAAEAETKADSALATAQQALESIPTVAQDLAWSPTPNNDFFIVPAANNVADALNMAYPKYIEFEQVSGNQFQAQLTVPIETMVNPIGRGLKLDAVIYTQYSMNRLMLSDYRFTETKIMMAWLGVEAAGGDSTIIVLQTEFNITPTSETTTITANRISYPL